MFAARLTRSRSGRARRSAAPGPRRLSGSPRSGRIPHAAGAHSRRSEAPATGQRGTLRSARPERSRGARCAPESPRGGRSGFSAPFRGRARESRADLEARLTCPRAVCSRAPAPPLGASWRRSPLGMPAPGACPLPRSVRCRLRRAPARRSASPERRRTADPGRASRGRTRTARGTSATSPASACPSDIFARYHRLRGDRRADGQRHGRARDAGHGRRRSRRGVAA